MFNPPWRDWLHDQGRAIVSQPLSVSVPGGEHDYAHTEGLSKLGWRVIQRRLLLYFSGQAQIYKTVANPNWKKGLWIYWRTPHIGDSLMDLACRSLFKKLGCSLDLWVHPRLSDFYKQDPWLDWVGSEIQDFVGRTYDFVIIQSMHHRSLFPKRQLKSLACLPWICMQDFYDVPNFARAVWGVQRVVDLWGISPLRPEEMCLHAQLKWQNWGHRSQTMRDVQKTYDLVFVLGGRDPSRTYASWLTVAQQVAQAQTTAGISSLRVGLIGVGNRALSDAQALLCLGLPWQIENWVNQTSFAQGIAHLERTRVVLVADGGAMHMASLAQVSYMVSLFTQHVLPGYRIADCYHPYALVSESTDVNGISPQAVAKQALRALSAQSIFP